MYLERPGQISFWVIFVGTNLLFFPMHIVGLLGMPRRNYTYPSDIGWTSYNLAETIGAFITAAGILMLFGNLVVSYFRGERAGPDPWHGGTLEWTVSSPPPEYNFAVIPTVSSAYPNWDADDRLVDARNLASGVMVLERGHEQPLGTVVDGELAAIASMPHDSPWPFVLTLFLSVVFVMLLVGHYVAAGVFGAFVALALVAWHWQEPEE
jgi:cytochrome c oxidase subunit 1/cytochrome c oxidase subunit I+III